MIISKIDARDDFMAYPAAIRKVLNYFRETDMLAVTLGRHDLDGDRIFVNVMDMITHPFAGSHPEVHNKYIDLMYWPEGGEKIGVAPYLGTEAVYESRPENDITLLEDVADENILTVTKGFFGIFFPWDAHRPGIMLGESPAKSRKCVAKIHAEALKE